MRRNFRNRITLFNVGRNDLRFKHTFIMADIIPQFITKALNDFFSNFKGGKQNVTTF